MNNRNIRAAIETAVRHEFSLYFADLSADARREGYTVDRETEWNGFVEAAIHRGDLPREAQDWL